MTRTKQVNNENGAVLNRDFPRQGRSLIMVPEEPEEALSQRKDGAHRDGAGAVRTMQTRRG